MTDLYDVVVKDLDGDWFSDLVTGSRRRAVARARHIAHAWPWERRMIVRVVCGRDVVDFNQEP